MECMKTVMILGVGKLIMITVVTPIEGFDEQWILEIQGGKVMKILKILD